MKSQRPLTDLYNSYVSGNLPKKELEGRIFEYLLNNYDKYRVFSGDTDRWNEFISWLFPRVRRAIDSYRDMGSTFEAYINCLVHRTSMEYRNRETDHRITEYVFWQARAEEMNVCETEIEYMEAPKKFFVPEGINPRQILLLLLKSYYFVSEEYVMKVAQAIGVQAKVIQNMIEKIKNMRADREAEILELRERIYCQHYRCLAYQKRMNVSQQGTVYYERMKDRFERATKRFFTMKKRLGGMRLDASNRMIAEVIGISKGTVDSALFALRNQLSSSAFDQYREKPH